MKKVERKQHDWQGVDDPKKTPVVQEAASREPALGLVLGGRLGDDPKAGLAELIHAYVQRAREWWAGWQRSFDEQLAMPRRNAKLVKAYSDLATHCDMRGLRTH